MTSYMKIIDDLMSELGDALHELAKMRETAKKLDLLVVATKPTTGAIPSIRQNNASPSPLQIRESIGSILEKSTQPLTSRDIIHSLKMESHAQKVWSQLSYMAKTKQIKFNEEDRTYS